MPTQNSRSTCSRPLSGLLLSCLAAAVLAGCAGPSSQRVDPAVDDDLGGTQVDSADVIAATDSASADLARWLLSAQRNNLVVAPATIKNESIQPFPTSVLSDRMIDSLVKSTSPRVRYLAREHIDAVLTERAAKREGVYAPTPAKSLLGADYLLTGRINSLSKHSAGDRADYFQLGFRLVDAEDGTIAWTDQYEFKKVGDAGVIYQ